jgi:hypothetical protein
MSMLVLHPRISTVIAGKRVAAGVSDGMTGRGVDVGGEVAVSVKVVVIEAVASPTGV